jgi:anti-anti-sigma factor
MKIGERKEGDVLVVAADGRLDAETADQLHGRLHGALDGGETAVILDLSKLDYISSAGLRIVLITARRLKESDGRFAVFGLRENVARVFKVSGFDTIIDTHPDEAPALAAFA